MINTFFAPAERIAGEELQAQMDFVCHNPVIDNMLGIVGGLLAVLNENRQILTVNKLMLKKIGVDDPEKVLGLRTGEALKCVFAEEGPGGCGTSKMCASCGGAIAIVTSLANNKPVERMCALKARQGDAIVDLYLCVRAQPLIINEQRMLLLFLQNITLQQHWKMMERVFFHDINNILTGMIVTSEKLLQHTPEDEKGYAKSLQNMTMRLSKEVQMQKYLAHPNTHRYAIETTPTKINDVLTQIRKLFSHHPLTEEKKLTLNSPHPDTKIWVDEYILIRILVNMITNALEASEPGDEVRVTSEIKQDQLLFSVWNRQYIPPYISGRIFQRNFSTKKETDHGIGTYSMKLFGESILGGKVSFDTYEQQGTTFYLNLPI